MRKPNIIIFLTDDQGYGDLSKTGNLNLHTPVIDKLELEGAKMDNFYTCPLCAPTRAELLTGRQFIKTGVHGVTKKMEYINLDETTIGNVFKQADYSTACFGKWHSGSLYPYHPNARGFDEFYGFCCGHWGYYFNTVMDHNGTEVRGNGYIIDDITDRAIDYINKNKEEPFLCYIAYNTPHSPYQVPDEFYDKFNNCELISRTDAPEEEDDARTRVVMAMCENIDYNMGRVIDTLKDNSLEEDTIIMYLSDNGPAGKRFNSGLKGEKGGIDEGSVRTACSITWKNHIPSGITVEQLASTMDILPTMASLADIECKTNNIVDGIDLKPYLINREIALTERDIFALQVMREEQAYKISVRDQKYRFLKNTGELFDIENDRGQKQNIAEKHPEITAKMLESCNKFMGTYMPKDFDTRYLTIGYKEHPKSYLNAQDGEPTGDITWSSIHPNCSYFINWNNETDVIKWPVSVAESGKFKATLIYTCKEDSVGNIITVKSNEDSCSNALEKEFDPELDINLDRVERNESYTKAFAEQYIGEIYVEKGINNITLSGTKTGSTPICEVRTLLLEMIVD